MIPKLLSNVIEFKTLEARIEDAECARNDVIRGRNAVRRSIENLQPHSKVPGIASAINDLFALQARLTEEES